MEQLKVVIHVDEMSRWAEALSKDQEQQPPPGRSSLRKARRSHGEGICADR